MKPYSNNTTGYKGVIRLKNGKYRARIGVNGVKKHIGVFDNALDAHTAYVAAAKEYFGEFARGS